jgi:cytoskeleton protein RodZ
METITTILRQAREHKGVSLKDAEDKTRIPLKYLQALEGGGESGLLADEVYLIPFLRSYANFLGIDANLAVTRFLNELQQQDSATVAPPERRPAMIQPRSGPSRLASWVMPFLSLLMILFVGSYLWQQGYLNNLLSRWRPSSIVEQPATTASEQSPLSTPPVAVVSSDSPGIAGPPSSTTSESPASSGTVTTVQSTQGATTTTLPSSPVAIVRQPDDAATGTSDASGTTRATAVSADPSTTGVGVPATTPVVPAGAHRLRIQAHAPTWMRVIVDSQPGKEMLLKAGESREWIAESGFTLSLGNAGGVILNLDGQDLPPAGKSGQVVKNLRLPAPLAAVEQ